MVAGAAGCMGARLHYDSDSAGAALFRDDRAGMMAGGSDVMRGALPVVQVMTGL